MATQIDGDIAVAIKSAGVAHGGVVVSHCDCIVQLGPAASFDLYGKGLADLHPFRLYRDEAMLDIIRDLRQHPIALLPISPRASRPDRPESECVAFSDPSALRHWVESGTLSRFHPLGPMRLPLAVTKNSPTSVLGGSPVARKLVLDRMGPEAGFKVATLDGAACVLMAVRGAWSLSRATRSLSGHWRVSGGGPASLVTLKTKRNSCLLSRWA